MIPSETTCPFAPVPATLRCFGRQASTPQPAGLPDADELESVSCDERVCSEFVNSAQAAGMTILDVGCGPGAVGRALLKAGAREVVGIEPSAAAATLARCRLTAVYQYDLETLPLLPYPEGYFDVITLSHVLSRLREPEAAVRHWLRWLKPGGRVVCAIANVRHQDVVLSLLVDGDWDYGDTGSTDTEQLRFFTLKSIRRFCLTLGLALQSEVKMVTEPPARELDQLSLLVEALGGDVERFRTEAVAAEYIIAALAPDDRTLVAPMPLLDPWRGSRPTRLLIVPSLEEPDDNWHALLMTLASDPTLSGDVTVGVALPRALLRDPPLAVKQVAAMGSLDLLLNERPNNPSGWARLLAGSSSFIATSSAGELRQIATDVGIPVLESSAFLSPDP